ncbi:MAG: ArnT family glycosyltransferase [Anaerolineae bacterium]
MLITRWFNSQRICFVLLILFAAFLAIYNLEGYPAFESWDEAYLLQFPRNLLLYGRYSALTDEGFGPFGGVGPYNNVSTGLPVMFPIALFFKAYGLTLWAARLVTALYIIGAIVAIYLTINYIYNHKVALIASLIFMFSGPMWLNTVIHGRVVQGEIPAMAYLAVACYLWFKSFEKNDWKSLFAAGLFFGLSTLTKDLFSFAIISTLAGIYMLDRIGHKKLRFRHVFVPLLFSVLGVVSWLGIQQYMWSLEGFASAPSTESFLEAARHRVIVFVPHLWYENSKFLLENGFVLWAIPALVYTYLFTWQQKGCDHPHQLFFPLFVTIWISWYVIASIGWHRYAYPGWAASSILIAKFLNDLSGGFHIDFRAIRLALKHGGDTAPFRNLAVLMLTLILIGYPCQNTIRRIVTAVPDPSPKQMARYIDLHLPSDARIMSEEWGVDFYSTRSYHHPPGSFGDVLIKHYQIDRSEEEIHFDVASYDPDYILDGPSTKAWRLFSPTFLRNQCKLVISIGGYDLYQVVKR